ncbi:MAG: nucleoside kinase [Spirochaetales bacterium]
MYEVVVTLNENKKIAVPYGTPVGTLLGHFCQELEECPVVACFVNNELTSLSYKLKFNALVRPVTLDSPAGVTIYRRSLCFLLTVAARELYPGNPLTIGISLSDGYFYYFLGKDTISPNELAALRNRMMEIIALNVPIRRTVMSYHDALQYFTQNDQDATAELLETRNEMKIPVHECRNFLDLAHIPLVPSTGYLRHFILQPYESGFILRFPKPGKDPSQFEEFKDSPLLFSIYKEYKTWGKILNVATVGQLNKITASDQIVEFIRVAEALHNKKIAQIADRIAQQRNNLKVILIAGPSSSGKTTFTKKLSIELRVLGFLPVMVSLDDYFLPRDRTPRDEHGNYDFEALEAIDVPLLNQHLIQLFEGKEVEIPEFDFKSGSRKKGGRPLKIPENGILLMEGIHGLNDRLTPQIDGSLKFKIYVSALTQLNIDEHTRIPTTDNRLIRRIVRDYQFRGHTAYQTLTMWPSVRRGEDRNIFPFQESADAAFNSALDYELGVLKPIAEPILKAVKPHHEVYSEAIRLLSFLNNFLPIPAKYVPETSILREFIGDSGFKY